MNPDMLENITLADAYDIVLEDLRKAENKISLLKQRLSTAEAERDRLKEAIKEFSDKWKYYDSKTITGLDDLRAALREVDGGTKNKARR